MADKKWRKGGLIYRADERLSWANSHAQIPTLELKDDSRLSILFASRDVSNRSHIGQLDLNPDDPSRIISIRSQPILTLGEVGTFDDSGVMPSCVVEHDGCLYLYYIGWNVRNTVPYHNSVGLAISEDGGKSYRRLFAGPVMDRTPLEPYFCATTCVKIENGIWRNWYLSCTGWRDINGRPEPLYHLKYAESKDGISWQREGITAIDFMSAREGGIVRASVIRAKDHYQMWYCYRGQSEYREASEASYRIGYAESGDGIEWFRKDDGPVVERSESGWDSEMVAYPEIVELSGSRYMFYNGNGFGKSGFGYAVWE